MEGVALPVSGAEGVSDGDAPLLTAAVDEGVPVALSDAGGEFDGLPVPLPEGVGEPVVDGVAVAVGVWVLEGVAGAVGDGDGVTDGVALGLADAGAVGAVEPLDNALPLEDAVVPPLAVIEGAEGVAVAHNWERVATEVRDAAPATSEREAARLLVPPPAVDAVGVCRSAVRVAPNRPLTEANGEALPAAVGGGARERVVETLAVAPTPLPVG